MYKVNNPQEQVLVGTPTPKTVVYKSEAHKLHQAFTVAKDKTIVQGQPVQLLEDGTIDAYKASDTEIYLGIAMTDSLTPAYPGKEVTVAVEAFAVVYGHAAAASLKAGYVKPGEIADNRYVKYAASVDIQSSKPVATKFINITPATEADELIQVLVR